MPQVLKLGKLSGQTWAGPFAPRGGPLKSWHQWPKGRPLIEKSDAAAELPEPEQVAFQPC